MLHLLFVLSLLANQLNLPDIKVGTDVLETYKAEDLTRYKKSGVDIEWKGEGINEIGVNKDNGKTVVKINKDFYRPTEVDLLIGDYSKAKKGLNWAPKTDLDEIIDIMYDNVMKKFN